MMVSLTSCGVRESLNEKIVEKVSETVVEKATDGALDMNIKDGEISFKDEDGEEVTFGTTKWPEDKAGALIPKFTKGKIVTVINSDAGSSIVLEEVEEKDFKAYIDEVMEQGYTNNIIEFASETGQVFSANKNEAELISILYDSESKTLHITYEIIN